MTNDAAPLLVLCSIMMTQFSSLDTVYISASLPYILTPGLLCRQMLHEFGGPGLRFVLFSGGVSPHSGATSLPATAASDRDPACSLSR